MKKNNVEYVNYTWKIQHQHINLVRRTYTVYRKNSEVSSESKEKKEVEV